MSWLARMDSVGQSSACRLCLRNSGLSLKEDASFSADRGRASVCERPKQAERGAFAVRGPPEGGCGVLPGAPNPSRAVSRTWGCGEGQPCQLFRDPHPGELFCIFSLLPEPSAGRIMLSAQGTGGLLGDLMGRAQAGWD